MSVCYPKCHLSLLSVTHIKEYRCKSKYKLGHVASYSSEIIHIHCIQNNLKHAEGASRTLQKVVPNVPTGGGFSREVMNDLLRVFGECAANLEKGKNVKVIQPSGVCQISEPNQKGHNGAGQSHSKDQYPSSRLEMKGGEETF